MNRLIITHHAMEAGPRLEEVELCLRLNEAAFDEVHVLSECVGKPDWSQSQWVIENKRLTMSEAFQYVGSITRPDDINVVANSDLMIPLSSLRLMNRHLHFNHIYCLSKRDLTPQGIKPWVTGWSQDAWCFRGRRVPSPNVGNYYFGLPGCDNRLVFELREDDFAISNPAFSIPIYHLHLSNQRTSTNVESQRVGAPYMLVTPHRIGERPLLQLVPNHISTSDHHHSNSLWHS